MSTRSPVVVLILVATSACGYPKSAAAPGPVSPAATEVAATRWAGTTSASLGTGRELFVAKCNGCHGYPDISVIADERWPGILKKMGRKAKLTTEQTDQVLHFVLAARIDMAATAKSR